LLWSGQYRLFPKATSVLNASNAVVTLDLMETPPDIASVLTRRQEGFWTLEDTTEKRLAVRGEEIVRHRVEADRKAASTRTWAADAICTTV
jgi:hypothetical protein